MYRCIDLLFNTFFFDISYLKFLTECEVKTNKVCTPFTYNGKEYNNCVHEPKSMFNPIPFYWCGNKYTYCGDCVVTEKLETKETDNFSYYDMNDAGYTDYNLNTTDYAAENNGFTTSYVKYVSDSMIKLNYVSTNKSSTESATVKSANSTTMLYLDSTVWTTANFTKKHIDYNTFYHNDNIDLNTSSVFKQDQSKVSSFGTLYSNNNFSFFCSLTSSYSNNMRNSSFTTKNISNYTENHINNSNIKQLNDFATKFINISTKNSLVN